MHYDFEQFVSKHKKEHTALNERVLKVAEASEQVVGTVLSTKSAVEQYATILTCLVEFNSIE